MLYVYVDSFTPDLYFFMINFLKISKEKLSRFVKIFFPGVSEKWAAVCTSGFTASPGEHTFLIKKKVFRKNQFVQTYVIIFGCDKQMT